MQISRVSLLPRVRFWTPYTTVLPTSEVRSLAEIGDQVAALRQNADDALLEEVHALANRARPDDDVAWLVDLEVQMTDDLGDELRAGAREERNGGDQRATVEVQHFL